MNEYYMFSWAIAAAFILDLVIGEPKGFPHPVILIGRIISLADRSLNRKNFSGRRLRAIGLAVAIIIPVLTFLVTALIIKVSYSFSHIAGALISIFLAYTTISVKGLKDAAFEVKKALQKGDIDKGRNALKHMVGRDTDALDAPEVVRGAVESVAENTSDGVIAPLFFLVIGGAPLAMAYKAVNTLDSMLGYKNERYIDFGRASARLDDFFNYVPARLTGFLMVAASFFLRMDWRGAWAVMLRDSRRHPSPNAGFPEAAAAGAMNIQLGGKSNYSGRIMPKPYIGEAIKDLRIDAIDSVVRLMYLSSILMVIISISIRGLLL